MIKVEVIRDSERFIREIKVRGHARYSRHGRDIVCAAVSALAYTAAGALEELAGIEGYTEKDGYMRCTVPKDIPEEKKELVKTILETVVIGLKQVELGYAKYVSVLDKEVLTDDKG
ncbi:MAG TPA: ribosomal-processing cysteine protease Prp [Acetivibrio sp.]|uniref:ribosomal-processing cysteine protease Prp n=1 Tax=Acetivibrio sp. TaxID=1872092 RepID=UPI002D09FFE3|nr:ribosomal-processing cysteine protease Prp [Acetivibrio sp.]HOM03301.1 ribosomal-processing cysteine protease Prp [Acetivibrio sp.]